jgi:hypothetical protein
MRKYGWLGGVAVLGIVVGAAWTEWSANRAEARAEAFGDAVIDALDLGGADERRAALAAIPADGGQVALRNLILATDPAEDRAGTLAALEAVIADPEADPAFRQLATLRRVSVAGADLPLADRRAALQGLAAPGAPFRTLAEEQLAYLLIEEGKAAEAIEALRRLVQDQEATGALRGRAGQIITALGGTPPAPAAAPAASGG